MPHHRGSSWHSSPPLISPPLLIILLPILALILLFLAVTPLLSAATTVLRPASVKTSWDSLNILLVVFAILCGVFAKRNDDEPSPPQIPNGTVPNQNDAYNRASPPQQWFGFSHSEERKVPLYDDETPNRLQSPVTGVTRLRRSSSSYPDLRQWDATGDDRYKFRFFDDFEIDKQFRSPAREQFFAADHRKRWPEEDRTQQQEEVRVKEIPVDTFEIRPSPPVKPPSTPPPPPPPPPLAPPVSARRRMHRKVESVSEINELDDREFTTIQSPPPAPSPPRPSAKTRSEHKHGKSERRKSNVKREIAMVWASVLSNQRKRKKKQRTKSDHNHNHNYDNVDALKNNEAAPSTPAPPPPPPPPPPPSVFHSLFRKGTSKSKKIHSVSTPPPPPPPPPSRRSSKRNSQVPPPPTPPPAPPRRGNTGKPPLPNKPSNSIDEMINAGNQSPLIPVPPPPPPFKMPAMKFVVRGDFVKIRSNQSSRCSSPERDHVDVEVSETTTVTNAVTDHDGDVGVSVFCPSPDVNVKAATFIARLRGEWRLEKLNSIKEKGNNGSLLHTHAM